MSSSWLQKHWCPFHQSVSFYNYFFNYLKTSLHESLGKMALGKGKWWIKNDNLHLANIHFDNINGYAHNSFLEVAIETLMQVQLVGMNPSSMTCTNSFHANGYLEVCRRRQGDVLTHGKSESGNKAQLSIWQMFQIDIISWHVMIARYTKMKLWSKCDYEV